MYTKLVVESSDADTDIWLVDENGHPVQQAIGSLESHVLCGKYYVTFGLRSKQCCPINLSEEIAYTQAELERLGMCAVPKVLFPEDEGYVEYDIP
ncbi:MAG: hypothetical protein O3C28_05400 [Proteobacteria bacterium]|nr:hypothetical protein [Pseudomonadota bacterium]